MNDIDGSYVKGTKYLSASRACGGVVACADTLILRCNSPLAVPPCCEKDQVRNETVRGLRDFPRKLQLLFIPLLSWYQTSS